MVRGRNRSSVVDDLELTLLGGFSLTRGDEVLHLSYGEARLVAFLAIANRPLQRGFVAGALWLDTRQANAGANLRTTLWRLRALDDRLVESSRSQLAIAAEVEIDLHRVTAYARTLLRHEHAGPAMDDRILIGGELLPDWYEDWVLVERERFSQLRLRALEVLCSHFTDTGEHALALESGLACVAAEPLRESAHRAVIRVHLAEGNPAEAVRQYRLYRDLVEREFGLAPSKEMRQLIAALDVRDGAVTRAV